MKNIMIDLETLGTEAGSVIVSIGAVRFGDGEVIGEFYERITINSCFAVGMTVDAETLEWWFHQPDSTRLELLREPKELPWVLQRFAEFVTAVPDSILWCKGASFDFPILEAAYRRCNTPLPWHFSRERCYRTAKAAAPHVPGPFKGEKHNAFGDAKMQAMHLMRIWAARA